MVKTAVLTMMLAAGASVGMALTPQEAADAAMARAEELIAANVRVTGQLEAMRRQRVELSTREMPDGSVRSSSYAATGTGADGEQESTSHQFFECIFIEDGGRIVNANPENEGTYSYSTGSGGEWEAVTFTNGRESPMRFNRRAGLQWSPTGYFVRASYAANELDQSAFDGSGDGIFTVETTSDEGTVTNRWEIRDGQALLHESTVVTAEKHWHDEWSEFEMIDGHWTPMRHESEEKTAEGVVLKHQVFSDIEITVLTPEELEAQLARPVAEVVAELHAANP